jgi:hypothetical protein
METAINEAPKAPAKAKTYPNQKQAKATAKQAHKEALAEPEFPRSLLQGFSRFDYSQLKPRDAEKLHTAAVRIRGRESKSMIEDGRDFIRIKDLLPHGNWNGWIAGEQLTYNMKMVQRAMSVARLCDGRSKHLEALPVSCLYDLAAKSIPDAVKDAVSAEADRLGRTPEPQWVWKQISAAKAEREAKKAPKAEAAKADAVQSATLGPNGLVFNDPEVEAKAKSRELAKVNAVALIVGKLSADDARKLAEYAEEAGWTDLADRLADAVKAAA